MAKKGNTRFLIAAFLVLLLTTIAFLFWYFITQNLHKTYQIYTRDRVDGLLVSAPVVFHGVTIGEVSRIDLVNPHLVRVWLDVQSNTPITQGTRATIISRGLSSGGFTGYLYISLEEVINNPQPLVAAAGQNFPIIPTLPSRIYTIDMVMTNLSATAGEINDLLHVVLDKRTVKNLKELVTSFNKVSQTLARNDQKLNSLLENSEKISTQIIPLISQGGNTFSFLQSQFLPQAYYTLSSINSLLEETSGLISLIKANPSVVIRGIRPPKPGPGEQCN